ncbi:hypothetical protein [uncultured Aquimarina sp.]|uniref:hypothetical protein n=1 Tax=uncultured Aquimarina sp. TaxID=575652 RepID=UPI002610BBF6|nr:hypothetical protein [uncultured Aquimarina sp.]
MKKIVFKISFYVLVAISISCKENKADSSDLHLSNKIKKINSEKRDVTQDSIKFKKILQAQIEAGKSALYDKSFDISTYKFTSKDLEAIIPIIKNYLVNYEKPSDEEFGEQIKRIFGRTIDFSSGSKYLYVNLENKSDREFKFFRNDNSIEMNPSSVFIIKEHNFITELYAIPEILNYRAKYSDISVIEDNMNVDKIDEEGSSIKIYKWSDFNDLEQEREENIKTLIARNKYLFNNDTSQLEWLLEHDKLFMMFLLKTYNYSQDSIHKDWYEKMSN